MDQKNITLPQAAWEKSGSVLNKTVWVNGKSIKLINLSNSPLMHNQRQLGVHPTKW